MAEKVSRVRKLGRKGVGGGGEGRWERGRDKIARTEVMVLVVWFWSHQKPPTSHNGPLIDSTTDIGAATRMDANSIRSL